MTRDLRVVHINNGDEGHGGAALAATRLHRSLVAMGVGSTMRVAAKATTDPSIGQLPQWPRFQRRAGSVMRRVGLNDLIGLPAYQVPSLPDVADADVLHFHLLEGNYFSYPALARITKITPAVLTLHDMWPLTGHCSFSYECERWVDGCGQCPHLDVYPAVKRDATTIEWRLKRWTYERSRLSVVAPSRWLAQLAERSMLQRFPIEVIPYGLDERVFAPRDKRACRQALGIAPDAVVIAAVWAAFDDWRKGPDLFVDALRALRPEQRARCTVAIMGTQGRALASQLESLGMPVTDLDYVWSETLKATLYSAADIFVLPTRADNSPLVILESLACETPVVSFDVGGVPETVIDGETGLVAPAEDPGALGALIGRLIDDADLRARLGSAGRRMVERDHAGERVAQRHLDLYRAVSGR